MEKNLIKEITKVNEWKGHNKRFFTCIMKDDEIISLMRDSDIALKVGDEVEYEKIDQNEYKVWRVKEPQVEGAKKQFPSKNYSKEAITMCMAYSKDLCVAGKIELKDLEKTADRIYARVLKALITTK